VVSYLVTVFETQRLHEICDRLEDELRQKGTSDVTENGRKRSGSDVNDINKVKMLKNLLY